MDRFAPKQASNHCKLLSTKAMVVSVAVNVGIISINLDPCAVAGRDPSCLHAGWLGDAREYAATYCPPPTASVLCDLSRRNK